MTAYKIRTREGCPITCFVEGQHVAAALDLLLLASRQEQPDKAGSGKTVTVLEVPFLIDGLLAEIKGLKAGQIVDAARLGGCLPGMVIAALVSIQRSAVIMYNKALAYEERQRILEAAKKH